MRFVLTLHIPTIFILVLRVYIKVRIIMNIKLLHVNINQPFSNYEKLLPIISQRRQNKILQLKLNNAKIVSLFTELFLRREISQQLNIPYSKICFGYSNYGKPFLINDVNYHFSVSHSEDRIAFISSNCPIGIDVEQILNCNMLIARRCFAPNEYKFIVESKEPNKAFYKIWTSKEAYVKMLGLGLYKSLRTFDVLDKNLKCNFSDVCLSEYMITVCSNHIPTNSISVERICEDSVLNYFIG